MQGLSTNIGNKQSVLNDTFNNTGKKLTVLQPNKSVQIRCQKWMYANGITLLFLLIFQAK